MMNKNGREHVMGGRNILLGSQQRRAQIFKGMSKDSDENLDLFSKSRRSLSVASSDDSSDVSVKLGRLSVGSAKLARSGIDDLLSSADGGKHDYDWLLTPPGTPLFPSSDKCESQPPVAAARSSSLARSASTIKASRLSVSQSEVNHSSRPTRSSSVTRSSVSTSQYSTSSYISNRSSSILNTSSASVSSNIRPSSPITCPPSTARPSTPTSRPASSRSSTPSRTRSGPISSSSDKGRSLPSARPSTPSSRPQPPANLNTSAGRSNSRPSTPTRRYSVPASPLVAGPTSTGRIPSGRNSAPASRASSPSPRLRTPSQPIVPPDFSLDTPPNLRTTLPDRPISAGRSRPGAALTSKANSETPVSVNMLRRPSSPITTRGRSTEPPARSRVNANAQTPDVSDFRKAPRGPELGTRKLVKSSTTSTESTGFGRTISKKSMDMAIRHMDIRNSAGNIRTLSGSTLFPQSIRSATSKTRSTSTSSSPASINLDEDLKTGNGVLVEQGNHIHRHREIGNEEEYGHFPAKLIEADIYESSRYDTILLKEDLKNTDWLHSANGTDQGPIFDNGFETLPEPFGLL